MFLIDQVYEHIFLGVILDHKLGNSISNMYVIVLGKTRHMLNN